MACPCANRPYRPLAIANRYKYRRRTYMKRLGLFVVLGLLCASLPQATTVRIEASSRTTKTPSPKSLSSYDNQVNELLSKMTLEEKIGQMTQAEQDALKEINDIENYFLGSLLSGGNSDPKAGN